MVGCWQCMVGHVCWQCMVGHVCWRHDWTCLLAAWLDMIVGSMEYGLWNGYGMDMFWCYGYRDSNFIKYV